MRNLGTGFLAAALCLAASVAPCGAFTGSEKERPHTSSRLVRVSGGGTAIGWVFGPAHQSFEEETGIDLDIRQTSSVQGLIDLVQGRADVATGATTLDAMLRLAAKEGVAIDQGSLSAVVVGSTKTFVLLNKSNPVTRLSKDQLKGIFTGKITRWSEVGGENKEITVVWGQKTPGHNDLISRFLLDGEPVTPKAVPAEEYHDIVNKVLADPCAVGIGPESFASGGVRVPEMPAIESEIIAVTKAEQSPEIRRLFEFLREVDTPL